MADGENNASPGKKRVIDWESIEREYRAGIRSMKNIGDEFGVSDAAIIKRAKRDDWVRDLAAKIKAKAEDKVSKAAVSAEVRAQTKVTERELVEANAQVQADIILAHRKDVRRGRALVMALFEEAEGLTLNRELFDQLGELLANPDGNGNDKLNELYRKIISLPGRTDTVKKLSESLKNLVGLERQAFGLKDGESDDGDGGVSKHDLTLTIVGVAPKPRT